MKRSTRGLAVLAVPLLTAAVLTAQPAANASPTQPNVTRVCSQPTRAHLMACMALRRTDIGGSSAATVAPAATPSGLSPANLQSAYSLPTSAGSGVTVAIVDAYDDPNAESDLAVYRSQR
jgi:subtilase family serine protease